MDVSGDKNGTIISISNISGTMIQLNKSHIICQKGDVCLDSYWDNQPTVLSYKTVHDTCQNLGGHIDLCCPSSLKGVPVQISGASGSILNVFGYGTKDNGKIIKMCHANDFLKCGDLSLLTFITPDIQTCIQSSCLLAGYNDQIDALDFCSLGTSIDENPIKECNSIPLCEPFKIFNKEYNINWSMLLIIIGIILFVVIILFFLFRKNSHQLPQSSQSPYSYPPMYYQPPYPQYSQYSYPPPQSYQPQSTQQSQK